MDESKAPGVWLEADGSQHLASAGKAYDEGRDQAMRVLVADKLYHEAAKSTKVHEGVTFSTGGEGRLFTSSWDGVYKYRGR